MRVIVNPMRAHRECYGRSRAAVPEHLDCELDRNAATPVDLHLHWSRSLLSTLGTTMATLRRLTAIPRPGR
jgi:hypothetical protein